MFKKMRKFLRLDLPLLPVVISTLAVLLSQLPPLYSVFSKPDIKIELGTNAQLFTNWGVLVFQPYLLLHNSGERTGLVKSAEIVILKTNTNKQIGTLPIQTFFDKVQLVAPNSQAPQIPVRLIRIEPGKVWANYVSAWKAQSESRQDKISAIISAAQVDFDEKFVQGVTWIMPEDIHNEARDLTREEQDKISTGKYFIFASALDENKEILDTKVYTFTLRKSHIDPFKEKMKEYRYGGGIIFPLRNNKFFGTWVEIYPVEDREIADKLYKQYLSSKA